MFFFSLMINVLCIIEFFYCETKLDWVNVIHLKYYSAAIYSD